MCSKAEILLKKHFKLFMEYTMFLLRRKMTLIIYPFFQRPLFLPCFRKTESISNGPKVLQTAMPQFCNFNLNPFYFSYWKRKLLKNVYTSVHIIDAKGGRVASRFRTYLPQHIWALIYLSRATCNPKRASIYTFKQQLSELASPSTMSCSAGSGVICSKKPSLTQSKQCHYSWLLSCLPQTSKIPVWWENGITLGVCSRESLWVLAPDRPGYGPYLAQLLTRNLWQPPRLFVFYFLYL